MKTIKIIDLLNKIAKGEEVPKKIRLFGEEFIFEDNDYYSIHSSSPLISYIGEDYLRAELNYEIEIIEEDKKIKNIDIQYWDDEEYTPEERINVCMNTIDKLIDEVNKLKGDKEELVNLDMKDTILEMWKSKLSYPFNRKDLEELENIINYYEEENKQLKEELDETILRLKSCVLELMDIANKDYYWIMSNIIEKAKGEIINFEVMGNNDIKFFINKGDSNEHI